MTRSPQTRQDPERRVQAPGAHSRIGLAGLTLTHLVDDLYQGAVPALLPFLAAERHYDYAALTGIVLAATCLSTVAQPGFGLLTDRSRLSWLVPAGVFLAGAGIGLAGMGSSYLALWLAVAVSGLGVAAFHPEATRMARGLAGDSTQAMSWFSIGGTVGIAVAPVLVTRLLSVTRLAGTPYLAIPSVLVAALYIVRWSMSGKPHAAGAPTIPAPVVQETRGPRPERRDDWPAFARLTGVVVTRSVLYFGITSFLALSIIHRFHQSAALGSTALTVFVAAGALGTLFGGWLADHWNRITIVRLSYACAIPAMVALVTASGLVLVFIAVIALGLSLFLPFAVQVTLGQDYLPHHIGTASGVTLGVANTAGGLAAPLLGLLGDATGLTTVLRLLTVVPAVALVLSFRLRAPDRNDHDARELQEKDRNGTG
jgi:MFS transporter, FSR family, fosmidomycin resistance protein